MRNTERIYHDEMTLSDENECRQLRHDLMALRTLMVKHILSELSVFNRNPEYKTRKSKNDVNSVNYKYRYNNLYYNELLEDLNGEFIVSLCKLWNIPHQEFRQWAMSNKKEIHIKGFENFVIGHDRGIKHYIGSRLHGYAVPPQWRYLSYRHNVSKTS